MRKVPRKRGDPTAHENLRKQSHFGTYVPNWPCACGLRGYRDRAAAKEVIKELRRKGVEAPMTLVTYRCDTDPDYWHVGRRAEGAS